MGRAEQGNPIDPLGLRHSAVSIAHPPAIRSKWLVFEYDVHIWTKIGQHEVIVHAVRLSRSEWHPMRRLLCLDVPELGTQPTGIIELLVISLMLKHFIACVQGGSLHGSDRRGQLGNI